MSKIPNWQDVIAEKHLEIVKDRPEWTESVKRPKMSGRVFNPFNYHNVPRVNEVNRLPSMTIPSDTLTMRELVQRHMRGLSVPGNRFQELPWDEVDGEMTAAADMPNPYRMSYMDRQDAIKEAKLASDSIRSDAKAELDEKALKKAKKAEEAAKKAADAAAKDEGTESESTNIT